MKPGRSTLVNAGVAVLACASLAAVWLTRGNATTSERESRGENLLPLYHSEEPVHLELESAGQKLVLERSPATAGGSASFRLLSPITAPADAATAHKFLTALGNAHALRPVDSGPPPSAFGLDKPLLRVSVRSAKGSYRLLVGSHAPTPEGARYVQVTSGSDAPRVLVVDKSVAEDLAVELDAFRQRSVVSVSEPDVTRIVIASQKLNVTLQRSSGISFLLDSPAGSAKTLVDRETLSSLFFQLSRLSASRFLTAQEGQSALQQSRAHFELDTKDPTETVRFDVGGDCPGDPSLLVVVKGAPDAQSACAPREIENTLRLSAEDLLDKHAFSLHTDEVEELDITGGKDKFVLLRKGNAFVLHAGSEASVELDVGNQRIASLLGVSGERAPGQKPSELGLEPGTATVTLRSSAARDADVVQQVVRVGKTDAAGNLYLYREQDGVVLRVPRTSARYFASDSTLLYSHKLSEFGLSSFVSAEILRPAGKEVLRRGTNEALRLDEPKGFDPDISASSDLIQALGSLTANAFVADRDDGSFGLEKPSLSVRFVSKSEKNPKLEQYLRFGNETALGVFATLGDNGPVFVLPRSVRDTCDTLLITRSLFPTNADTFSAITLEAHGRTLHLQRDGEELTPVPAGSFPPDKVPALLEALDNLRPDAAIHTGPALPAEGLAKPSLILRLTPKRGAMQTVTFGAGDSFRESAVFYLRVSGVDATYVMAQSKVRALSDAL
ncbi:MAG TPA: DUF4340 domain-containing protein [Polyangiaceae bacterium]